MNNNIFKVNGKKNIGALILSVLIAEGVGIISGFLGMANKSSYQGFNKPVFSPPPWLFPIVWAVLYFLMAVAAYRIWLYGRDGKNVKKGLVLYSIQLIFNFLWTIIFFRLRLYGVAFFELIILLIFIMETAFTFYKDDKIASFLMIPYIAWVSFAGVLNLAIWLMNK